MPRIPKVKKVLGAMTILRALEEHLTGRKRYKMGGKRYTKSQVAALFQAHLDAIQEVDVIRASLSVAVAREREVAKRARTMTVALKSFVSNEFGATKEAWSTFGWKLPQKPGPKTVAAKLEGVRKRAEGRAARK